MSQDAVQGRVRAVVPARSRKFIRTRRQKAVANSLTHHVVFRSSTPGIRSSNGGPCSRRGIMQASNVRRQTSWQGQIPHEVKLRPVPGQREPALTLSDRPRGFEPSARNGPRRQFCPREQYHRALAPGTSPFGPCHHHDRSQANAKPYRHSAIEAVDAGCFSRRYARHRCGSGARPRGERYLPVDGRVEE